MWMPGFCRGWGEVGEVAILKKEILCGSRCPRVRGSGRAPGRGRDMAIGGVGVRARGRQPGWGPERSVSG